LEPLLKQILSHGQAMPGVGCDFEFPPLLAPQPQLATKTFDAMYPDMHPVSGQIPLQPLSTVGLSRTLVSGSDLDL
jgi:hypothetical protein